MSYNRLIFVVESNNPRQHWSGKVNKAFEEFFEAHKRHSRAQDRCLTDPSCDPIRDISPEPGNGPEHAVEASNGLRVWWHNPGLPEDMKPDPPDLEAIQQVIDDLSNNVEDDET